MERESSPTGREATDTNARIEAMSKGEEIDQLLRQMAFMAEARSSVMDPNKVSAGGTDSRAPAYNGKALLDAGNEIADSCISLLAKAIRDVAHAKVKELTHDQLTYWVIVANEGRGLSDVSERLGVSVATIASIRERNGRNPETGKRRKGPGGRPPSSLKGTAAR